MLGQRKKSVRPLRFRSRTLPALPPWPCRYRSKVNAREYLGILAASISPYSRQAELAHELRQAVVRFGWFVCMYMQTCARPSWSSCSWSSCARRMGGFANHPNRPCAWSAWAVYSLTISPMRLAELRQADQAELHQARGFGWFGRFG